MMVRRGRFCGAVLLLGLLSAGCERGAGASGSATTGSPVAATGPTGQSQSARLAGLKDCATTHADDKDVDCVVKSRDKARRVLEATGPGPYKVEVFDADGVARQALPAPEEAGGHFGLPEFKDLDGDGSDEVLLPFGGGGSSGAMSFEVWRAAGSADRFVDMGRIEGHGDFPRTSDGKFFADYGRGGAGLAVFRFYRFAEGAVVEVLTLDVHAQRDGETGEVVGTTCGLGEDDYPEGSRAKRDAALEAAGLDPAAAERAYCAEPRVRSVFGG